MALLRYKLYDKHTKAELIEMAKNETNPKKQMEIAHAITLCIIDDKKANGTFVQADGYSGRNSKRR